MLYLEIDMGKVIHGTSNIFTLLLTVGKYLKGDIEGTEISENIGQMNFLFACASEYLTIY